MKQTDKGILINRISYGDSSFIVTVYTLEKGIQKFIFQGAKKKKVPIYPLLIAEITYYKRPDSELGKLTAVEAKNHLQELSFDPIKSVISFFIADVLLKCLKHEYEDSELYFFLESFIQAINDADDLSHFPIHFLTEFSKHLGICPNVLDENPRYFNLIDEKWSTILSTLFQNFFVHMIKDSGEIFNNSTSCCVGSSLKSKSKGVLLCSLVCVLNSEIISKQALISASTSIISY